MSNGMRSCAQGVREVGQSVNFSAKKKWYSTPFLFLPFCLLLENHAAWASPFGDRYSASPPNATEIGYGSTPLAACRDFFNKSVQAGFEPVYTIEVSAEGAIDTGADPFFVRGPACSGISSIDIPGQTFFARYAFEVHENAGIDFYKNLGSDCSTVTNNGTNPVNIGTGNKLQRESDYESDTLVFKRTYNETFHPLRLGNGCDVSPV
jgi:hypothetical protein